MTGRNTRRPWSTTWRSWSRWSRCPTCPPTGGWSSEVDVEIDQAFLGSCTNGRIEDLRIAAEIIKGKKVKEGVRMIVVPASVKVYQAGDGRRPAGRCSWTPGPSSPDRPAPPAWAGTWACWRRARRCVSTTNRNFIGRMGHKESEVYLAGPAVVAASAVAGKISCAPDIRMSDHMQNLREGLAVRGPRGHRPDNPGGTADQRQQRQAGDVRLREGAGRAWPRA